MRLPRDLDGADLVRKLKALGYSPTRQRGSHVRVTTRQDGEHHEVVPMHSPLKLGTLRSILRSLSEHHGLTLDELAETFPLVPKLELGNEGQSLPHNYWMNERRNNRSQALAE